MARTIGQAIVEGADQLLEESPTQGPRTIGESIVSSASRAAQPRPRTIGEALLEGETTIGEAAVREAGR